MVWSAHIFLIWPPFRGLGHKSYKNWSISRYLKNISKSTDLCCRMGWIGFVILLVLCSFKSHYFCNTLIEYTRGSPTQNGVDKNVVKILERFFVVFFHSMNIPWKILDRSCNHSTVVIEKKNIFGIFWGFNGYFSVIGIDQIQNGLGEVFAHQGQPGNVGMYRSQTILHHLKRNCD